MTVRLEIVPTTLSTLGLGQGLSLVRHFGITEGETVSVLLKRLVAEEARLANNLYYPETGALSDKVEIVLNSGLLDVKGSGLLSALKDGDRLAVVPAGGG